MSIFLIADNVLNHRISRGFQDLSDGSFSTSKSAVNAITSGNLDLLSTSEFRWYHFMERLHYVIDRRKLSFGIGLANEDSWVAEKLHFVVGTTNNKDNSIVPQIDTGDITWSLLILQIGAVGIIFFINAYFSLFRIFYANKEDGIMTVGLLYIVSLFISSLYMIDIIEPYYVSLLALFSGYAYNLNMEKKQKSESVISE